MTTTELIEELSKKPKDEIKYALMALMVDGKLDFVDLNASYVNYLEFKKDDNENMLIESDTCIIQMMFLAERKKKLSEIENNIVQRGLYRLNQSKRFNTKSLNEKFHYIGDDRAKELSWYEFTRKI